MASGRLLSAAGVLQALPPDRDVLATCEGRQRPPVHKRCRSEMPTPPRSLDWIGNTDSGMVGCCAPTAADPVVWSGQQIEVLLAARHCVDDEFWFVLQVERGEPAGASTAACS